MSFNMREQFEKLPYIKIRIEKYGVEYNDELGCYVAPPAYTPHADWVSGAWYAYQEQQKKIDAIKKMIVSLRSEFDLWSNDTESFDAIEVQIENLEELLK